MNAKRIVVALALLASVPAGLRWLRVAQREHYVPGSATTLAKRWWGPLMPYNAAVGGLAALNALAAAVAPMFGAIACAAAAVGPFGLRVRGRRGGPLRFTRRMRVLTGVWAAVQGVLLAIAWALPFGGAIAAFAVLATPVLVDVALALTRPLEERLSRRFVDSATRKLRSINPTVVGITGSYGKTSTKGYAAHLIEGSRAVAASPASFNNTAGLSRAVNESLPPGTEVFIAEMGTYGRGEIASMCRWLRPKISAITAIGPVHLERMRSEENITEAKAEIFETAEVALCNVDSPHLRRLADRLDAEGRARVVRCSAADHDADVYAGVEGSELVVRRRREEVGRAPARPDVAPSNVAIAVAIAHEVGVPDAAIAASLATLPSTPNRRTVSTNDRGLTIIDDTFNSNPAGARAALESLADVGRTAERRAVITPGMIELGPRQHDENRAFAARAAEIATHLVVVGQTNRRALIEGASGTAVEVVVAEDLEGANEWVRAHLQAGDAALFENDLPDHYP